MFVQTRLSHHREGFQLATVLAFAVAVISPVQSILGGYLPKRVALVVSGVALIVALVSQGLQAVERRRQARTARERMLANLLSEWPLPRVDDADPYELGVLPAHLPAERMPYIPRDADAEVVAALRNRSFVLLTGPVMAGKSRTALEAVRQALPGARLIVPRNPEALIRLTELDQPLEIDDAGAVLWLDDLDVYLQAAAFDVKALEALEAASPRVVVVATLDSGHRDRLLRADGHVGRLSRMVLARACSVGVRPLLSHTEQLAAAQRYDRPITGTVGSNFAVQADVLVRDPDTAPAIDHGPQWAPPPAGAAVPPAPASPRSDVPRAAAARAGRRRGPVVAIGFGLAVIAVLLPLAAVPAVACGLIAFHGNRRLAGVAVIATSAVLGLAGVAVYYNVDPAPPRTLNQDFGTSGTAGDLGTSKTSGTSVSGGASDQQVLEQYFAERFSRCQQGLSPEFPDCGRVLDAINQQQWLQLHGYDACRAEGGDPGVCVQRLPR